MSAWILAWIDRSVWAQRLTGDPNVRESIGAALKDVSPGQEPAGFGKLRGDAYDVPFVESVPSRLVLWSGGELALYPATTPADVREFIGHAQGDTSGPVLVFAIDYDEVERRSAIDVGEAVAQLVGGARAADLGHTTSAAVRCADVSIDDTVAFAWHRNALFPTNRLTSSMRHEIEQSVGRPRRQRKVDAPLRLAHVTVPGVLGANIALPLEPSTLMVLLGRNGAGKTTILESIALALERVRGVDSLERLRTAFPSLRRRRSEELRVDATVVLRAESQDVAPDLFHRLLFLLAYSPFAPLSFRLLMPEGRAVWDQLTPVDDPTALDPRHLLERLERDELRQAFVEAMVASVPGEHADIDANLRAVFDAYLSGGDVCLGSDGSVSYRPPAPSLVSTEAAAIPAERYAEMINASDSGHWRDALFWALSAIREDAEKAVQGLHLPHPRSGAMYVGWERSPWTELHDDVVDRLRASLPSVVPFDPDPGPGGVESLAEGLILDLVEMLVGQRRLGEAEDAHPFASDEIAPVAARVATCLAARATELLPAFAREAGEIRLTIAPPEQWHRRRVRVELGSGAGTAPLAAGASGVVAWGVACLRFAAAQLRLSRWSLGGDTDRTTALVAPEQLMPQPVSSYQALYLADEPEAHLHPTAVRDVVDVCDRLAGTSTGGCIVATHALEFLGRPEMVTAPLVVDGFSVTPCPPGLPALRERAEHLGISPAMVLTSARAVLCVEGPADETALNVFAGDLLDRSYVHTLRLFGMHGLADRLPELDLVYGLDIPVYLILDHVRASKLRGLLGGKVVPDASKEERELHRLAQALRGRKAVVAPLAVVDIVRTIPDEAMVAVLGRLALTKPWPGWGSVDVDITELQRRHGAKFKEAFEKVTGASVTRVIKTLPTVDLTGVWAASLRRVANTIVADVAAGAYHTQTEQLRVLPAV